MYCLGKSHTRSLCVTEKWNHTIECESLTVSVCTLSGSWFLYMNYRTGLLQLQNFLQDESPYILKFNNKKKM